MRFCNALFPLDMLEKNPAAILLYPPPATLRAPYPPIEYPINPVLFALTSPLRNELESLLKRSIAFKMNKSSRERLNSVLLKPAASLKVESV